MSRAPDIVVGIGNLLCGDDGVGVEVARRLAALPLPDHVEAYDGGTSGLDLACIVENRRRVVVVDAFDAGEPPGAVFRLSPERLRPISDAGLSVHDFHLLHALDETKLTGSEPEQTIVFAVQVADTSAGIGLSAPVHEAVERVIALVAQELDIHMDEARCSPGFAGGGAPQAGRTDVPHGEAKSWY
ncbi:MAG: hydrogenase maturation protease [Phycisphaerae bacterium]|nr:hydrogenase maturation protease [Phycisphaerae bacterium]